MDLTIKIIGYIAAFCTTFAYLPQAIKTINTKHTADLSLPMAILLEIGIFIWLIYGILINDYPIIGANAVTFIFTTIILVMKLKYK
ncbi:SemiSWEET transporter [soil metagenome]